MNNNVKKYWVFALVAILLPFGLYWVIKQPCGFTDIGGDDASKEWLSFWSNYLGALISSIAAFIILGVTYNQNRKENRLNRELQIQAIMQQQERDRMLQLRKSCTIYSNVFDVNEFIAMVEEMKVDSNIVALKVKSLLTELGVKYSDLIMYLPITDIRPQEERTFIDSINAYNNQVARLILDIQEINRFMNAKRLQVEARDFGEYMLSDASKASDTLKGFIDSNITNEPDLSKFIVSYILTYTNCSKVLQTAMQVYFRFENERVNNIFKRDEN